jgi:hypothetical protein
MSSSFLLLYAELSKYILLKLMEMSYFSYCITFTLWKHLIHYVFMPDFVRLWYMPLYGVNITLAMPHLKTWFSVISRDVSAPIKSVLCTASSLEKNRYLELMSKFWYLHGPVLIPEIVYYATNAGSRWLRASMIVHVRCLRSTGKSCKQRKHLPGWVACDSFRDTTSNKYTG